MSKIAQLLLKRRRLVGVSIAVVTACAIWGLTRLKFDDNFRNLFRSNTAAFENYVDLTEQFGSDENDIIILLESEDLLSESSLEIIYRIHLELKELEASQDVFSIYSARKPMRVGRYFLPLLSSGDVPEEKRRLELQQLQDHPLVSGHLLNDATNATLIIVRLDGEDIPLPAIQETRAKIQKTIHEQLSKGQLTASLTGLPIIRADIVNQVQRDQILFMGVGILISIVIAWLLFRNWSPIVLTAAAPQVGMLWTLGAMGIAGEPLNVINVMVIALILVIGLTDSIHLVFHIRQQRDQGQSPILSAQSALVELSFPCFLTSITTAIGFGALAISEDEVIRRFALTAAPGTLIMLLAVLSIVPWMANGLLGSKCLSPARPSRFPDASWIGNLTTQHAKLLTALGVLTVGSSLYAATKLNDDFRYTENLPSHHDGVIALQRIDRAFSGSSAIQVVVRKDSGIDFSSDELYQLLSSIHGVFNRSEIASSGLSLLNLLESMPGEDEEPLRKRLSQLRYLPPEVLARFVNRNRTELLLTARVPDLGSQRLTQPLEQIMQEISHLQAQYHDYKLFLTGMPILATFRSHRMIQDLTRSLVLASVLVFVVLAVAFRSFRFGLLSIIPNTFPLVVTAALMVVCGVSLRYSSIMCFSICLGVAVDDTVHFLARFRKNCQQSETSEDAISRTTREIAPILVTTTLLLLAGFGATILSGSPMVRLFGILSSCALGLALIGDLILLPSTLQCFGLGEHSGRQHGRNSLGAIPKAMTEDDSNVQAAQRTSRMQGSSPDTQATRLR